MAPTRAQLETFLARPWARLRTLKDRYIAAPGANAVVAPDRVRTILDDATLVAELDRITGAKPKRAVAKRTTKPQRPTKKRR